ncbi:asparagine synthase (glutamine-hydrolyzing) [Mucisphaera calidilacus]|uniref:asparagine synthase (glutamine-hydrolyzing) n=1 Tax=Mucisphaera calidilacus TaxID=2527982 RepID=A0A518BWL5_9BACT|nr:asparagine synthase (glutamine-hydrolyzing) [Mucisphaera calidilacus]QDU71372.1 Asparagine synthetase [glutamine-hydrolyzing] 1 [Mucisphaera calidilacus]
MCGIAGILRHDERPPDRGLLEQMLQRIRHRGPDGQGITDHGRCSLVHARLSVIDLLSGQQPMHVTRTDNHGPLHLIFNGEIYNHHNLRRKLTRRGHAFASDHSDTEVLLYGYRQWGQDLPKHLHGMFVFAIWDEDEQSLFLARDRTGKKPLYIQRTENDFRFASLIPALLCGQNTPRINRTALLTFLRYGYTFGDGLLQGIEEVPPAHTLHISRHGERRTERYWRPPPISKSITRLGAVDALREVLTESVDERLESDVPLGCFLSGGIDSSVVAALAQQQLKQRDAPSLRTFSIRIPGAAYDESAKARAVAQHIGAVHTVLDVQPQDIAENLRHIMRLTGDPTADSSILPTYWLCHAARQHVTVALSGDGGDELFGGYDRYRAMRLLRRHGWWLKAIPYGWIPGSSPRALTTKARRLLEAASKGRKPAAHYHDMIHLFRDQQIRSLIPGLIETEPIDAPQVPDWPGTHDRVHAAMRWDLEHYLPHVLLRKVDRASMAVALEVRCPILDTQVCDLAGHLPDPVLMPHGRPKGLLRQLAAQLIPRHISRLPKRGFAIPLGDWFRTRLTEQLHDAILTGNLDTLGLQRRPIAKWFDQHQSGRFDHTHRLFALWQLALWNQGNPQ